MAIVRKIELILMILCGVLCFGFSRGDGGIVTDHGPSWLWLQESLPRC